MNYYEFEANDQMWNNWLIFAELKEDPWIGVKPRYRRLLCPKCDKFDHDAVFKEGFDADVRIRGRGDIIATDDGFHCINEKVKRIIEAEHYKGITLKPLGNSGWHVASITLRLKADPEAYELHKPFCRQCKRAAEVTGLLQFLSQVDVPKTSGRFFSTLTDRHCSSNFDRPVLVSEDIVVRLKKAGIKGGMFRKLLNADEEAVLKTSIAKGKCRWPANSKVLL